MRPKFWPDAPSTEKPLGRSRRPKSAFTKKKALSLTSGPPRLAPYCFSLKVAIGRASGPSPTMPSSRVKKYAVPWKAFEPLRVIALTPPPEKPPWRTS